MILNLMCSVITSYIIIFLLLCWQPCLQTSQNILLLLLRDTIQYLGLESKLREIDSKQPDAYICSIDGQTDRWEENKFKYVMGSPFQTTTNQGC
jgi:hypothetical protein